MTPRQIEQFKREEQAYNRRCDSIRKRCGDRRAFDWFVQMEDLRVQKNLKRRIEDNKAEMDALIAAIKRRSEKAAAITLTLAWRMYIRPCKW